MKMNWFHFDIERCTTLRTSGSKSCCICSLFCLVCQRRSRLHLHVLSHRCLPSKVRGKHWEYTTWKDSIEILIYMQLTLPSNNKNAPVSFLAHLETTTWIRCIWTCYIGIASRWVSSKDWCCICTQEDLPYRARWSTLRFVHFLCSKWFRRSSFRGRLFSLLTCVSFYLLKFG